MWVVWNTRSCARSFEDSHVEACAVVGDSGDVEFRAGSGDVPELRWLFSQYSPQLLADWVRQSGWYLLPR